jgi:RNA polymerase sigma factor (sigma-70 family)
MPKEAPQHPAAWLMDLDRQYRPSLLAFFRRRSAHAAEAEDMVQEVFARLYATAGVERETAGAYIFRAAANLLSDRARRDTVRAAWQAEAAAQGEGAVDSRDPERVLAGQQALGAIQAALNALPERTRVIFVLYRLEGMPQRAIAESFGLSVSAVEKHIAKAMKALMHLREAWQ